MLREDKIRCIHLADEGYQHNFTPALVLGGFGKFIDNLNGHIEFFHDLTEERLLICFAFFEFSAGKFPLKGEGQCRATLPGEYFSIMFNHRTRHSHH
ncbi:hypothetical protein D3C87_1506110 [compost metagenome]